MAIAQLLLEALILLFQLVNPLLFLETTGTKGDAHQSGSSVGGKNCGGVAVDRRCGT